MQRFLYVPGLLLFTFVHEAVGEDFRFNPVSREVIEARLPEFESSDRKREESLRGMFREAGCDDRQLTEQPVKGSKLPNLICVLPGSSGDIIIVGARFEHAAAGQGLSATEAGRRCFLHSARR